MISVFLTILLCLASYLLGSLIGWERTVKMQRSVMAWLRKRKAEPKANETAAK